MMKRKVLSDLKLKELIGTDFEEKVQIKYLKKENIICRGQARGVYVISGSIQYITYTPSGEEFYSTFYKGDLIDVNYSLLDRESVMESLCEVDIMAKEDSVVAYIPFGYLKEIRLDKKEKVIAKIMSLGVDEYFRKSRYLILKNTYSDEDFFVEHLEDPRVKKLKGTRDFSEFLNIKLRSIQRYLKKFQKLNIIEWYGRQLRVKDIEKLEEYRRNTRRF